MYNPRDRICGIEKRNMPKLWLLIMVLIVLSAIISFSWGACLSPTGMTIAPGQVLEGSANIVAVGNRGDGVMGEANVEIRSGIGRILVATNPFNEPDIQQSIERSITVAASLSGETIANKDFIISFDIDGDVIGGSSAGAAITSAATAALQGLKLKDDAVVSGTINIDGSIGMVGGIIEKIQTAAERDIELFLIPRGQGTLYYYEPTIIGQETEEGFLFDERYYIRRELDLRQYAEEELGMTVVEVSDISDVYGLMVEEAS